MTELGVALIVLALLTGIGIGMIVGAWYMTSDL